MKNSEMTVRVLAARNQRVAVHTLQTNGQKDRYSLF